MTSRHAGAVLASLVGLLIMAASAACAWLAYTSVPNADGLNRSGSAMALACVGLFIASLSAFNRAINLLASDK